MRLNFKRIEIHSFMSFEDEIFDFDSHNGITLIRGLNKDIPEETNGAGKTTIFSSLTYALFGQIQDGEVVNRNIVNRYSKDKDMRLVLTFDVDGVPYKIIRGMTNGKQSYLELYKFDEDITKSTISETQDHIEKELIQCDISIFLRTIMLTASQDYNFYKMKKSDKKDFVEKLFDISVFGDIYQRIHRDILDFDKDITSRQNRLLVLNRSESEYAERMRKYDADREIRLRRLAESMRGIQKKYDTLKACNIATNKEQASKLENAINKIQDARKALQLAVNDITSKNQKIELALHKLNVSRENKATIISKHSELLEKLCDDCRPIASEYYKIGEYQAEIGKIDGKIAALEASSSKNAGKKADADQKIQKLTLKLTELNEKLHGITDKFNLASRELAVIENQIASHRRDMSNAESETNPFVELYNKNHSDIDAENAELSKIEGKYKYLKFAENIVSQETLRKFIISDLIGLLNNKIKMYLTKMGSKYTVVFDTDMNYEFVTNGGNCQFGNFSGGEKMRIMIATSFAFRDFMSVRNGLNTNILVCDEFFDSAVSSACLRHIISILKDYVKDYNQNIYVITQRQELEPAMIDNVIQVVKERDTSKITYPD